MTNLDPADFNVITGAFKSWRKWATSCCELPIRQS